MDASRLAKLVWAIALVLVAGLVLTAKNNTVLAQNGTNGCTDASSNNVGEIGAGCSGSSSGTQVPGGGTNGSGSSGNNSGSSGSANNSCVANMSTHNGIQYVPMGITIGGKAQCITYSVELDSCNKVLVVYGRTGEGGVDCPGQSPTQAPSGNSGSSNNCSSLVYSGGSISCKWNFPWQLFASVTMPPIVIDVRPYPATLVNWPTTYRIDALATNQGSGTLAYAGWGGGMPGNPMPGDWRSITLTLTMQPTGNPLQIAMSLIPTFTVPAAGATKIFQWNVASHPAVGADTTAGAVGQLGELPSDMPLFKGNSTTTYRLFYSLTYQIYSEHTICKDAPTPTPIVPSGTKGPYSCVNEQTIGQWTNQAKSGEILPSQVANLPSSMNGGSVFNDWTVVIQRMDDSGNVNDPVYAHQYSWGDTWYFAVREGQGQIGGPGLP
jgi:hypothetical protein